MAYIPSPPADEKDPGVAAAAEPPIELRGRWEEEGREDEEVLLILCRPPPAREAGRESTPTPVLLCREPGRCCCCSAYDMERPKLLRLAGLLPSAPAEPAPVPFLPPPAPAPTSVRLIGLASELEGLLYPPPPPPPGPPIPPPPGRGRRPYESLFPPAQLAPSFLLIPDPEIFRWCSAVMSFSPDAMRLAKESPPPPPPLWPPAAGEPVLLLPWLPPPAPPTAPPIPEPRGVIIRELFRKVTLPGNPAPPGCEAADGEPPPPPLPPPVGVLPLW